MSELNPFRLLCVGSALITVGAMGFYFMPAMIAGDAEGHRIVNSIYCSVITLTTIGYGDICPGDVGHTERSFIVALAFCGLGMFCGPIMDYASSWTKHVPWGATGAAIVTVIVGLIIFVLLEGMDELDAIYFTIITGTTIGYGNLAPKSDIGKLATSLFAILSVNVMGALLEPTKRFLTKFCSQNKVESKAKDD